MDDETIEERLRAVERAVSEGEAPEHLGDLAALTARVEDAETTVADLEDRLAELEAAVQAVRGYVGAVRGVNRDVERRADSALATAERAADAAGRDRPVARTGAAGRTDGHGTAAAGRESRDATGRASPARRDGEDTLDAGHPIPEPPSEERSLRDRIAAWL